MNSLRNMEKAQRALKNEDMAVIITSDAAWLNGDAIQVVVGIQKVLKGIVEEGFPKELAKSLIEVAFMNEEELDKFKKNLEKEKKKNK